MPKWMSLVAASLLSVAAVFLAGGAFAAEGRTHALLIGLDYRNDTTMPAQYRLRYCANDVRAVREMLVGTLGVAEQNIVTLTDDDRPDAGRVKRAIAELANRAAPGDRIILFFSGHGVAENGQWAMVTHRFLDTGPGAGPVWNREITPLLERSAASEKIFLVDACHAGGEKSGPSLLSGPDPEPGSKSTTRQYELGGWGDLRDEPVADGSKSGPGGGVIRLASSGFSQKSREFASAEMGVFTHAMTRAARRLLEQNPTGDLTLGDLFRDIYREVDRNGNHTPFLSAGGGRVHLAGNGKGGGTNDGTDGPDGAGGRIYALVVGLAYPKSHGSGVSSLTGTRNDAARMREALIKYGGCADGDVVMLLDARPNAKEIEKPGDLVPTEPVTKDRLMAELRKLADRAGKGDRIIFHFSGHGGSEGGYGFICPSGYRNSAGGVWYTKDIKPILEGSQAASKWMILDACESGTKTLAGAPVDMFVSDDEEYSGSRNASFPIDERVPETIKFSGAFGEESTWDATIDGKNMGVFTYYLVKGLSGEADANKDGIVTGGELVNYVQPQVMKWAENKNVFMKPKLSANGFNVVIAATRPIAPTPPPQPPPNPPQPPPPQPSPSPVAGRPPLHQAALSGSLAEVQQLLESGASLNDLDDTGWNALYYATSPEMLELMFRYASRSGDERVNRASRTGLTPLHVAAMTGRESVAEALLKMGADRAAVDKWGKTPQSYAIERNNKALIDLLDPLR